MAKDNTLTIIGVVTLIFFSILLIAGLTIFSPAQEKPLSVSNPSYEEPDLSTLPRQTVDTSVCYTTSSCIEKLKEEGMTYEEFKSSGLELNCNQIPCYVQGVNYVRS